VCQPKGEVPSPGWSLAGESHVVAVIGPEGGHADAGVVVVVVGELHSVEVCPVVLLVVAEYSEVSSDPFIVVLHLSLGLRVVWCQESLVDS
jgi:hypothetical protein